MAIGSNGCGGVARLHPEPDVDPMTDERRPLAELLATAGSGDFLPSVTRAVLQLLMEADAGRLIGVGRHERSGERTTYRDCTLDRRKHDTTGARSRPLDSGGPAGGRL